MNNYKFTKIGNPRIFIKEYDTDVEAQSFADSYDGGGWTWVNLGAVPAKSSDEILIDDKQFLSELMDSFILQNRIAGVTSLESQQLLQAFGSIQALAVVGAVPEVYGSIQALVPPIGRVYTEERKQDDLNKIAAYMATR